MKTCDNLGKHEIMKENGYSKLKGGRNGKNVQSRS